MTRRPRPDIAAAIGLVLVAAASHPSSAQATVSRGSDEPAHVAIVGVDYAFVQLPSTLSAGPTLFSFENRGTKRHEMSILLLRPGIAPESLLAINQRNAMSSRAVADSIVGLLLARPGDRAGGQLYVNLMPGRTYVVVCNLRDAPDARQHADLGMIGTFRVP